MKWTMVFCAALGVWIGPALAWAQVAPVTADEGVRVGTEDKAAAHLPQRSPLWTTVEGQYRHRGAERSVDDRRLTAAQRQELREQIRRGAGVAENAPGAPVTDTRPMR